MSRTTSYQKLIPTILLSATMLSACGDEDFTSPTDGGLADAAGKADVAVPTDAPPPVTPTDGGGDTLTNGDGADAGAPPTAFAPKGIVVLHNNEYTTTSVSISDLTGTKRLDDCIHTGSTVAGLTTALSGNVYLPTTPLPSGEIALIDSSTEVITFLDPATCSVKRQVRVGPSANKVFPQDFLWTSGDQAYVSRNGANPTPTAAPGDFDEGNDILIVNPLTGAMQGRIDLEGGTTPQADATFRAKPSQMAMLQGKVFVALNNIANGLGAKGGNGRIAAINPVTNRVEETIEFAGVKNCGAITVAGPTELMVACNGDYAADQKQIDFSGVVLFNSSTKETTVVRAGPFGEPVNNGQVAASGKRFFATTYGEFMNPAKPSKLWTGTFQGEPPSSPFSGVMDGDIGSLLLHPTMQKLYVADAFVGADMIPKVRVLDISTGPPFAQAPSIPVGAKNKFPVRGLAWF